MLTTIPAPQEAIILTAAESSATFHFSENVTLSAVRNLILTVLASLLARSLADIATTGVANLAEATTGLVAAVGLSERALTFTGSRLLLCEAGHVYILGSQKRNPSLDTPSKN